MGDADPRPRRILVLKFGAMGDVAMAIPAVHAVREANAAAQIAWAIRPAWSDLLERNPDVDLLIETPRSARGLLAAALRARAFKPDLVLDMQGLFASGLLAWASRAPARYTWASGREFSGILTGNPVVPGPEGRNVVECLREFASLAGATHAGPYDAPYLRMEAGVAEAVLRTVTGFSRPLVGLHLGASEANKRWPLSHWTALAADLAAAGLGVAVLGGTGEVADGRDIAARSGPGVALLAGKTTVRDLAYVVANCDVVVGGDTGAVHVAALVGTPTVCMMGATDPTKTGPYGPRHQVIHLGMDCSPCFRRPTCAGRFDCMVGILPEDVRDACLRSLAMRYRSASRVPLG